MRALPWEWGNHSETIHLEDAPEAKRQHPEALGTGNRHLGVARDGSDEKGGFQILVLDLMRSLAKLTLNSYATSLFVSEAQSMGLPMYSRKSWHEQHFLCTTAR